MAAKPDVIMDFGSVNETYVSLADRPQNQTGIPYLLIDGRFDNTVGALRMLGSIFSVNERAERLARRTQEILDEAGRSIDEKQRPHVYLARRANGLETGNRGLINTEIIERAGGVNVVDTERAGGGLVNVSLEQVLRWNPDTIITTDRNFADQARAMSAWADVEEVRRSRIGCTKVHHPVEAPGGTEVDTGSKLTVGIGDLHTRACVGGSSRAAGQCVIPSSMA